MPRETFIVHRHDRRNIGDMSCAPTSYLDAFPWLAEATTIDIEEDIPKYAARLAKANVIYGGGGLLGTGFFDKQLAQLMALNPPKLICWSAGHNNHDAHAIKMPSYMERFDLVGVRDYGTEYPWVPCVSAMIPRLESPGAPTQDVVVYRHWDDDLAGLLTDTYDFPTMLNNVRDLDEVLDFLASGKTVVTNSYHGAYWATLMGRKVVVVSPFSSKFYGLRYSTPVVTEGDWRDSLDDARTHTGALKECRKLNLEFAQRVRDILEST